MTPSEIADWHEAEAHKYPKDGIAFRGHMKKAATIRELEAGCDKWEAGDGLDGSVVHAVREVLNRANVPTMAFIDDHVALLVHQRDAAEAKLKIATEALEFIGAINCGFVEPKTEEENNLGLCTFHMQDAATQALARIKEV